MRLDVHLPDQRHELVLAPEDAGRRLTDILRRHNLPLNTRCGERDLCAGCTIELVSGTLQHADGSVRREPGEIRACRYSPLADRIELVIPERARLTYAPQILDSYRINVPYANDPIAREGIGVAVDIGTTTVAVQAFELDGGKELGRASAFNRQMHFGDDVLTRINLCSTDPSMPKRLQQAIVVETLQPLVDQLVPDRERITVYAVSGNTTMLHLCVAEDPSTMGVAPFAPRFLERPPFLASSIGLSPADAQVCLLPSIAAYVGADLTGGLFASGLLYDEGPCLLVDVGTNGEILLRHEGRIYGCATAAGPAFEGSGLTGGMRAGDGAIDHIAFDTDPFAVRWNVIGPERTKPAGICGSGYVDFLARGRQAGLLGSNGRFQRVAGLDGHLVSDAHGRSIRIALAQGKRPILVSERDVARLLQAKAAIAAGILTLLDRQRLAPQDVRTLYLAGGFGMHLDLASSIGAGLLPGFRVDQIELVGNTSLAGAALVLHDRNTLTELSRARHSVEIVELNLEPGFEDTYLDQLALPGI